MKITIKAKEKRNYYTVKHNGVTYDSLTKVFEEIMNRCGLWCHDYFRHHIAMIKDSGILEIDENDIIYNYTHSVKDFYLQIKSKFQKIELAELCLKSDIDKRLDIVDGHVLLGNDIVFLSLQDLYEKYKRKDSICFPVFRRKYLELGRSWLKVSEIEEMLINKSVFVKKDIPDVAKLTSWLHRAWVVKMVCIK